MIRNDISKKRHQLTVTLSVQDLGGEIFGSSTECICLLVAFHIELAKTKIAQSDVASIIKEDVFRLQVTESVV